MQLRSKFKTTSNRKGAESLCSNEHQKFTETVAGIPVLPWTAASISPPSASSPALSLIGPYEVWQLGFAPRKKENSLFKEWTGSFGNSADKGFSQSLKFGS